jgi:signal peptidase I
MSTTNAVRPAGTHVASRPDKQSRLRRLLNVVTSLLLAVGLLGFLFLAVGPHLFGYRTSTMLTGSMEPGIMPGDVVVTVPEPASELEVGDVITYQIPVEDHRVETHRVTQIRHHDGQIVIRTKGDANQDDDPWTATLQDDTVWEMKAVVPHLGTAVRALRAPVVQHGILWVGFGGLILLGLSTIWGTKEEE